LKGRDQKGEGESPFPRKRIPPARTNISIHNTITTFLQKTLQKGKERRLASKKGEKESLSHRDD